MKVCFHPMLLYAFKYFLLATDLAETVMEPLLRRKCYSKFSNFYLHAMLFDDAVDFKQKEGMILRSSQPIDSTAFMWVQFDLQLIEVRQKGNGVNEKIV